MKNNDVGEGEGGEGLINFPPMKRGGLNRGFTVHKLMYIHVVLVTLPLIEGSFL